MRRIGNFFLRKKNEGDASLLEPPSPPVVSPTSAAAAASAAMAELHIDRDLESPSSVSSPMSPGSRAPGKFAMEDEENTWPAHHRATFSTLGATLSRTLPAPRLSAAP